MEAKNLARDLAANGENPTLSSKVQDRSTDVWGQEKMHAVEKPGLEPFLCTLLFWGMACMAWLPVRWDRPWGSEPGTRYTYPNGTSTWITHWETFAKSKYSLQNRMKSLKVMASGGGVIIHSCCNLRRSWEQGILRDCAGRWYIVSWQQGSRDWTHFQEQVPLSLRGCLTLESQRFSPTETEVVGKRQKWIFKFKE